MLEDTFKAMSAHAERCEASTAADKHTPGPLDTFSMYPLAWTSNRSVVAFSICSGKTFMRE